MRIVAGKYRGSALIAPKDQTIRPTSDRIRENLFNIIAHNWPEKLSGSRVLDLFAGTGALGLEALSRGAGFALFVDNSVQSRGLLRSNIENLAVLGISKVFRRDACQMGDIGTMLPFDLVFADPPYGKKLAPVAAENLLAGGWLTDNALLVLEEKKSHLPERLSGFERREIRTYGDTEVGIFSVLTQR